MKDTKIEYHPNGELKHKFGVYDNDRKYREYFCDENGKFHREAGLPDHHSWYQNGITYHITFYIHGCRHNISNPADIWFSQNGKIGSKYYNIDNKQYFHNKLNWMNSIKTI
jgi:hypothetical protein